MRVSPVIGWVRSNILGREVDYARREDAVALGAGVAGATAAGLHAVSGGAPVADKLQHGAVCFTSTLALGGLGLPPSLCAGFTFTVITVGKEFLWDGYLGRGTFDGRDVAANLSGSLAGYSVLKAAEIALRPPEGAGR